jgi:hypothetical protein
MIGVQPATIVLITRVPSQKPSIAISRDGELETEWNRRDLPSYQRLVHLPFRSDPVLKLPTWAELCRRTLSASSACLESELCR